MRLSTGFWQTFKEVPADAEIASHRLMLRAGLIHKSGPGLFNYLPFGLKTISKVEKIIREEMERAGSFEILMSVVTPGELWKESGRWDVMGDLMLKIKDKGDRDLCISPTNEEAVVDIFRKSVKSYKSLPLNLYQINTKFRDEIRPRFGLMRGREFTMKDAYSFHIDKPCLDKGYQVMYGAYEKIFNRLGLDFSVVEADGGAMATGEAKTHEFQVLAKSGEDEIIYCKETGYCANIEKAQTKRANLNLNFNLSPLSKVETKGKESIEDVCEFLGIPQEQSLKSLVYKLIKGDEVSFIMVILHGDDQLNDVKLLNYTSADHIAPATDKELLDLNLVKGYMSPLAEGDFTKVIDGSINPEASFVIGADLVDFHQLNFNIKRDLPSSSQTYTDLRTAKEGDHTLDGLGSVEIKKGIEVGHIFQLGDKYTKGLDVQVLDNQGKAVYPLMGCYGIGVTRIVAAAIEQNHDERGIVWPKSISPYDLHLVRLAKQKETEAVVDGIYKELMDEGFSVVYDDRKAGAGFKFKDADLLGLPLRVVFGERDYLQEGVIEIIVRKTNEKIKVPKASLVSKVKELWEAL